MIERRLILYIIVKLQQFVIIPKLKSWMIFSSTHYFARKEQFRYLKNTFKNQILKLSIFVLICVLVASLMQKNRAQTSYTFYYAQNKIVNKHTRGIFPPLQGNIYDLFGCWSIQLKIGQQKIDVESFKKYQICFEELGRIALYKNQDNCFEKAKVILYSWRAFSHNLFISQLPAKIIKNQNDQNSSNATETTNRNLESEQQSEEVQAKDNNSTLIESSSSVNVTESGEKQIYCFNKSQIIFEYMRSFTVWTYRSPNLYLISEAIIGPNLDVSIFVLTKSV